MNNQYQAFEHTFHEIINGDDSFEYNDDTYEEAISHQNRARNMATLYQSVKIHRSQIYPDEDGCDSSEEEDKKGEKPCTFTNYNNIEIDTEDSDTRDSEVISVGDDQHDSIIKQFE